MNKPQKLTWNTVFLLGKHRVEGREALYKDYIGLIQDESTLYYERKWTVHKTGHMIAIGYCQNNQQAEQAIERVFFKDCFRSTKNLPGNILMQDDELQETVQQIRQRSQNVREYALNVNARIQDVDRRNRTLRKHSYAMQEQAQNICEQNKTMCESIIKRRDYGLKKLR